MIKLPLYLYIDKGYIIMIKVAICDNNIYYREKIADLTLKSLFDTIDITFRYYDDGLQIIDEAVKIFLTKIFIY